MPVESAQEGIYGPGQVLWAATPNFAIDLGTYSGDTSGLKLHVMADKEIVSVRQAKLEDVPQIVGLLEVLFTIEADFCIDKQKQTRGVELLLADKGACALVAVLQDKVVGLITIQRLISTAEGGYVGLIEDVVVDGQSRKKGIGRQLEKAACSWALENGLLRVQLLADSSNSSALNFYSRLGWKETNLVALRKQ